MKEKFVINNLDELMLFAEDIETESFPGMVISLIGDLGTGKTTFTKAFGSALKIKDDITSPTFNIVKEYKGKLDLYHVDVYRLDEEDDKEFLEDYFSKDGITVIEWADLVEDYLPEEKLEIKFKAVSDNKRVLVVKAYGDKYENILSAIS